MLSYDLQRRDFKACSWRFYIRIFSLRIHHSTFVQARLRTHTQTNKDAKEHKDALLVCDMTYISVNLVTKPEL